MTGAKTHVRETASPSTASDSRLLLRLKAVALVSTTMSAASNCAQHQQDAVAVA
jgi:GH24 family phage-related lysozyme (muramidase)